MRTLVIGVAGGTGSGKTTLTRKLVQRFGNNASVVSHDNYYKAHSGLTYEERSRLNYDSPEAFDTDLMVKQLKQLIAGRPIDCPIYDFTVHNRSAETKRIEPAPIVIVEGILIFCFPKLCELFDLKLFMDADADVRVLRRVKRDVVERGRSIESVEKQYLETVKPMHDRYVEPSKRMADLIIPQGGHNLVALEMIIEGIRNHRGA